MYLQYRLHFIYSKHSCFGYIQPKFGICFDIDGVLARGTEVLEAAVKAFKKLVNDHNKVQVPVVFVTNALNRNIDKAMQISNWLGIKVYFENLSRRLSLNSSVSGVFITHSHALQRDLAHWSQWSWNNHYCMSYHISWVVIYTRANFLTALDYSHTDPTHFAQYLQRHVIGSLPRSVVCIIQIHSHVLSPNHLQVTTVPINFIAMLLLLMFCRTGWSWANDPVTDASRDFHTVSQHVLSGRGSRQSLRNSFRVSFVDVTGHSRYRHELESTYYRVTVILHSPILWTCFFPFCISVLSELLLLSTDSWFYDIIGHNLTILCVKGI